MNKIDLAHFLRISMNRPIVPIPLNFQTVGNFVKLNSVERR